MAAGDTDMSEWLLKTLSTVFRTGYVQPAEDLAAEMERNGELSFDGDLVIVNRVPETVSTT
jgi:hypothetical protein